MCDRFIGFYTDGDNDESRGYFSIYLFLDVNHMPKGKAVTIEYFLTFINHKDPDETVKKGTLAAGSKRVWPEPSADTTLHPTRVQDHVPDQGRAGVGRSEGGAGLQDIRRERLPQARHPLRRGRDRRQEDHLEPVMSAAPSSCVHGCTYFTYFISLFFALFFVECRQRGRRRRQQYPASLNRGRWIGSMREPQEPRKELKSKEHSKGKKEERRGRRWRMAGC